MSEVISILSGKGGTGKTFAAANLSLALQHFGEQVVCIDTDINSPNLSLQLGNYPESYTLEDVLNDEVEGTKAISIHESGLMFVPASQHFMENKLSKDKLKTAIRNFSSFADRIIIDAPPGFGESFKSVLSVSDRILIVTNPELQALQDAKKIVEVVEKLDKRAEGVILNKLEDFPEETPVEEVERFLSSGVVLKIPQRQEVKKSIHRKEPLALDEHSKVGTYFKELASQLSGEEYKPKWYSPLIRFARKLGIRNV